MKAEERTARRALVPAQRRQLIADRIRETGSVTVATLEPAGRTAAPSPPRWPATRTRSRAGSRSPPTPSAASASAPPR